MIYKQIWGETTSWIHSAQIRRRWSTILETWNTLNYAEQIPGYNALIVSLLSSKRYCILYLWNLPQSYGWHASTESNKIWCIIDFELCDEEKDVVTESDLGNQKNQSIITSHSTHWRDVGKGQMNRDNTISGILDRFPKDPRYRETQEKLGWIEAKCTAMYEFAQEDHAHKLTKAEFDRYRSNRCAQLNDAGCSSRIEKSPVQKFRRLSQAISATASRPKTSRMQSLRNMSSRTKDWSNKLGGHFGRVRLLQAGGTVKNGTDWKECWSNLGTVIWFEFNFCCN